MFRKEEKNWTRTRKVTAKCQKTSSLGPKPKERELIAPRDLPKKQKKKTSPPEVPLWQHGN